MGSDLPGEGIEGGRGGRWGGKRGEGEGKERCVFYWVFGAEAKEASTEGLWSGGGLGHSAGLPLDLESITARRGARQPPN